MAIIAAAVIFRSFSEPYGRKSSLEIIEKFMLKKGPGFARKMDRAGWSLHWGFSERVLSVMRKSNGRSQPYDVDYPCGFFYS